MNTLPFNDATELYIKEFWLGRNNNKKMDEGFSIFPYNIRHIGESFIEVKININDIELYKNISTDIVDKYIEIIKQDGIMSHVWFSVGKKLNNGDIIHYHHTKIEARDGNHRISAYKILGHKYVIGYLPKSHFEFYSKVKRWQTEL